jgi:hypothetical protein
MPPVAFPAAPLTPILKVKMKIGSRMLFAAALMLLPSIEIFASPLTCGDVRPIE